MTIGSALDELAKHKHRDDGRNSSLLIDIEAHLAQLGNHGAGR